MKKPAIAGFRFSMLLVLAGLWMASLSACNLPVSLPGRLPPSPTPTPTEFMEACAWTWAYGQGSPEFDVDVTTKLSEAGIQASVVSSSFGEDNSCTQSYSPMSLDVQIVMTVESLADSQDLDRLTEMAVAQFQVSLPLSRVPNLGNLTISFADTGGSTCRWDRSAHQCMP